MKLCAAAMLLAMAWAAPAAGAAQVAKRDPAGDVRGGAQLSTRGRAALDIARVTARRDTAGLAVDVRLRGDFERRAGSGALKRAVGEILLRRKPGLRGILLTRGDDRRARVRSQRVGSDPVVVRDGRLLRFPWAFGLGARIYVGCPRLPPSRRARPWPSRRRARATPTAPSRASCGPTANRRTRSGRAGS